MSALSHQSDDDNKAIVDGAVDTTAGLGRAGDADNTGHTDSTNANMIKVAASHFGDFHFPSYSDLGDDDGTTATLPEDAAASLFGQTSPLAGGPDTGDVGILESAIIDQKPAIVLENTTPAAASSAVPHAAGGSRAEETATAEPRQLSFEDAVSNAISENFSPDSADEQGGANLLVDEPIADEFGLVVDGSLDVIDLGGSGIGSRPPLAKDDKSGDAAPPWSELKTKAGKERKRLPLACIGCRRKKIRCSGEKPACKHCLRSRALCVYKATARKAAPRTDYMAMLDRRLRRMEDRIIKVAPSSEQETTAVATSSIKRAGVKPTVPGGAAAGNGNSNGNSNGNGNAAGSASAHKTPNKKRPADEAFGADLNHWARLTTKNRLAHATRPHNSALLQQESEENKLLQEGAEALPSRELQEHLAEVFFEYIYGQAYHVLHKPSYMRKLRAGTLPPVLILSVCAISARFSSHPALGTGTNFLRGEEWASLARDIVMRRYEWPNITILTCLLILGLHEFGTCHGGRSWSLGGMAIRMAFALQLHKDLDRDPMHLSGGAPLSFTDREIRRRTMWACFLMDRFNSSGTDRPTFIKEESIKIQLPIKERHFQLDMPGPTENLAGPPLTPLPLSGVDSEDVGSPAETLENMGVAAYMIRAIAVWGRVINYLNQGGKELDPHPMWNPKSEYTKLNKQADEMLSSLPPSLQFAPDNLHQHETEGMANQFLFLHIAIQQNILFMNRFAVSSPNGNSQQDIPKAFVTKAGAKAFAAANRISELLKEAESYIISAPFVGYCAFLSSTVHIFGIFSGNPTMEATSKRNLATNIKYLTKMKRYWGMFHFMTENLSEQYRSCADAARQGTPASENAATASPIFQYGDWFDRYPHGVSNSDFADPATYKKKEKGDDAVLEQKPELRTVEEFFTHMAPTSGAAAAGSGAGAGREPAEGDGRPMAHAKRKSIAKKGGTSIASSRSADQPQPQQRRESLPTDLNAASAEALQQQQKSHAQGLQPGRHFQTALGGQTSGQAGFNALSLPHSQAAAVAAAAASYRGTAMSPMSPAAVGGPFSHGAHSHRHQQQQQTQAQQAFYSPDLLALSLSQQADSMMPQLDRQLVFGAYGESLDAAAAAINGHAALDGLAWDGAGPSSSVAPRASQDGVSAAANADAMHIFAHGHEPSSAWFMPFNMDPPEIGQDIGGLPSLDQFANLFGGGISGMPSQGGAGMGGLH